MENDKKGYYAIIPAVVRYDKSLSPNAKLLYGEITALCNEKGFCWATNEYFADLYGKNQATISRWIKQIKDCGYINIQYIKRGFEIKERKIYISEAIEFLHCRNRQPSIAEIVNRSNDEIINGSVDEIVKENTTVNITKNNTYYELPEKDLIGKHYKPIMAYFFKGYQSLYKEPFTVTPKEGKAIKKIILTLAGIDPDKVMDNFIKKYDILVGKLRNPQSDFMQEARLRPSLMLFMINDLVKPQKRTMEERKADHEKEMAEKKESIMQRLQEGNNGC